MQEHIQRKPHPDPPLSSKVGILIEAASQRLAPLLLLSQHIFVWKGDWYILLYDQLWICLRIPTSLIDKPIVHHISLRLAPLGTLFGFLLSLCHMPWLGLVSAYSELFGFVGADKCALRDIFLDAGTVWVEGIVGALALCQLHHLALPLEETTSDSSHLARPTTIITIILLSIIFTICRWLLTKLMDQSASRPTFIFPLIILLFPLLGGYQSQYGQSFFFRQKLSNNHEYVKRCLQISLFSDDDLELLH